MELIRTIAELRSFRKGLQGSVGFVPTMGYLHAGHLSLVKAAQEIADGVIVSIFVNPSQFGPNEDLANYPVDIAKDLELLEQQQVDAVFLPDVSEIYPANFQTTVSVSKLAQGLEGARRPGHFDGVATVVSKLFNIVQPDHAFFGQKDAQQVVIIRQMVRDLNFPISIHVCPIIRDTDGLALSSRNVYLKEGERILARKLSESLRLAQEAYEGGLRSAEGLRELIRSVFDAESMAQVDYVSVADCHDLTEIEGLCEGPVLVSLTVKIGKPRLLDNCLLPASLNNQAGATRYLGV